MQIKSNSLKGTEFMGSKYIINHGSISLRHNFDDDVTEATNDDVTEPSAAAVQEKEGLSTYIIVIVCIACALSLLSAIAAGVSIITYIDDVT